MVLVAFGGISIFFEHLSITAKFRFIFSNLFIFGQDLSYLLCDKTISIVCANPLAMNINPPAWTLSVELGFYLIAPFILKSEKKTFVFVLLGCGYLLSINYIHFPINLVNYLQPVGLLVFNYHFYPSSIIFFGGGALAYHLSKKSLEPHYFAAIFAIILLSFTQTIMPFWHLLFISMAIPVLFDYTATNTIDRSIGELSYPTYILHWPVLLFVRPFVQSYPDYFKLIGLGTWVAIISSVMGFLIYFIIESRVSKFRYSKRFFGSEASSNKRKKYLGIGIILLTYSLFPIVLLSYIYSAQ